MYAKIESIPSISTIGKCGKRRKCSVDGRFRRNWKNKMIRKRPQTTAKSRKCFTICFTSVLPKGRNGQTMVKQVGESGKTF